MTERETKMKNGRLLVKQALDLFLMIKNSFNIFYLVKWKMSVVMVTFQVRSTKLARRSVTLNAPKVSTKVDLKMTSVSLFHLDKRVQLYSQDQRTLSSLFVKTHASLLTHSSRSVMDHAVWSLDMFHHLPYQTCV